MKYKLIINNVEVEVENMELSQVQILLNKEYESLSNPTLYYSEYSRSINIPFTSRNNKLFSNIFRTDSVVTNQTLDPRKKIDFVLLYDNDVITKGYLKVSTILDDLTNKYYVCNIFSTLGYIINEMKQLTFDTKAEVDSKYIIDNPLSDNLVINKNLVRDSFEKTDYSITNKTDLDYICFFPQYQGKYSSFDSNKIEVNNSVMELDTEYDEHEMRQYRSYYQGVGVFVNGIIGLIKDKIYNLTGYNMVLDTSFFNTNNPYWTDLIYTTPTLFKEDSENQETAKKEKYKIYENQYKYNILNLSDLSNSHKQILPFNRQSGHYLYDSETKRFNMDNVSSSHFHESLVYTIFMADVYNGGLAGYARLREDNCIYLKIKAIDSITGRDIPGAYNTYMFYSGENDRLDDTSKYDYAIDVGITSRNYPNAVTNPGTGYEKDKGFYWQGEIIADFDIRTDRPYNIVADVYTANNGKVAERAISEYIPRWDWLWVDMWQSSNDFGYTNGMTFFLSCVNANVEHIVNVRSNSKLTMERVWNKDESIYDMFIKYMKMFHLMFDLDEVNKRITILPKETYFRNYTITDWSNKLDRNKSFTVQPVWFDTKYLSFQYENGTGQRYDYYQNKYNVSYGSYKINTHYDFNNNTKSLIDGLKSSMISTKKQSSVNINTKNPEQPNFKGYGYKYYPAEVFVENDNDGTLANNYGSFYFHNGVYSIDGVLSPKDSTGQPAVAITDDTSIEIKNNSYCYNTGNYVACYHLPLISTYDKTGEYSIHFAEPKELYFNQQLVPYNEPKYLYNLFWKKYLDEIYSVQSKLVTCHLYITPNEYKNFKFNNFIVLDNILYRVNKIIDYDITTTNSTKCELMKVQDIKSYTTNNYNNKYLYTDIRGRNLLQPTTICNNVITLDNYNSGVVLDVISSSEWSIKNKSAWIEIIQQNQSILHFTYYTHTTKLRFGSITLQNTDGCEYVIMVLQQPLNNTNNFTLSPNSLTFDRSGGTQRVIVEKLNNDLDLIINSKPEWCEVEIKEDRFATTIHVTTAPNLSRINRSGTIVVKDNYNVSKSITVAQQGTITTTTITDDNDVVITAKPIVIPAGGTTTITATTTKPLNPNTIVITGTINTTKPLKTIGAVDITITPKVIKAEESDGGRMRIYTQDGKPIVVDYNVGKVLEKYTIHITGHCTINGEEVYVYYEDVEKGTELNIVAIVPNDKEFVEWSDGDTNISKTLIVTEDINIYPILKEKEVDDNILLFDDGRAIEFDNNEHIQI